MFVRISAAVSDPLLASAWHRMVRLWQPMAGWTLLLWAGVFLLVTPISSILVTWRLGNSERLVIGNEELLAWLLTPGGITYMVFTGSVATLNWVLRYAGLFQIVTDDLEGRESSLAGTALRLLARITTLVRFSAKAVALALLALAPVAAGSALIYYAFLGEHDINYFLTIKPPAWYRALLAFSGWMALSAFTLAYLAGRIALALPSWLDGYRGFFVALRRSWALTRSRSYRLLRLLGVAAAGWLVARFAVGAAFLALAGRLTESVSNNSPVLWPIVVCVGAHLAGSVLLNLAIEFLGFSYLSTLLTKFYLEDTPLHRASSILPADSMRLPRDRGAVRRWLAPRRAIPLVALSLAASTVVGTRILNQLPETRPVTVTAHRGGPPPAPENTLAALERAIAAGADFAEIDVLRTRDGVVVVAHDADLMRLARDPRRIAESTFAELRNIVTLPDDGSPPEERRLATLGDFLTRARHRIRLNIELKYYRWDPLLADAVVREIREHQQASQVMLMSLNLDAVRQLRQLAPGIPVGYISTVVVGNISRLAVDFVAVNHRRVTPQLIREARLRGQQVHAWTVNAVPSMADLMELGVDGIITDDPALAVRVRNELASMSPVERLLLRFRKVILGGEATPPPAPAATTEIVQPPELSALRSASRLSAIGVRRTGSPPGRNFHDKARHGSPRPFPPSADSNEVRPVTRSLHPRRCHDRVGSARRAELGPIRRSRGFRPFRGNFLAGAMGRGCRGLEDDAERHRPVVRGELG